jgi:hypothetical protein
VVRSSVFSHCVCAVDVWWLHLRRALLLFRTRRRWEGIAGCWCKGIEGRNSRKKHKKKVRESAMGHRCELERHVRQAPKAPAQGLGLGFQNPGPSRKPSRADVRARLGSGFQGSAAGACMALGRALQTTIDDENPSGLHWRVVVC